MNKYERTQSSLHGWTQNEYWCECEWMMGLRQAWTNVNRCEQLLTDIKIQTWSYSKRTNLSYPVVCWQCWYTLFFATPTSGFEMQKDQRSARDASKHVTITLCTTCCCNQLDTEKKMVSILNSVSKFPFPPQKKKQILLRARYLCCQRRIYES